MDMTKAQAALAAVREALGELPKESRTAQEIIDAAHASIDTSGLGLSATPTVLTDTQLAGVDDSLRRATASQETAIRLLTIMALSAL